MQKLDQSQFSFISQCNTHNNINKTQNKIKITHKCIGGNELSRFCVNKKCQKKQYFFCNDEDCECYENHELCSKNGIKTILKKITQKYALESQKMTILKAQISEIFTQIIDKISEYQEIVKKSMQNDLKIIALTNLEKNFYQFSVEEKMQNFKEFNSQKLNILVQMNHEDKLQTNNSELNKKNNKTFNTYQRMFSQSNKAIKHYFQNILVVIKQKFPQKVANYWIKIQIKNQEDKDNFNRTTKRQEEQQRRPRRQEEQQRRPIRQEEQQRPPRRQEEQQRIPTRQEHQRPQRREYNGEMRLRRQGQKRRYDRRSQPIVFTKIGAIQPADEGLNLIAQVVEVQNVGKRVRVTLGDETGIVKAFFKKTDAIKVGESIALFKAEAKVVKQNIEIQIMNGGKVDVARRRVEQVNKNYNVSAKEWVEADQ